MMDPPYTGPRLDARSAGSRVVQAPREIEDPFRYGSRWVEVETAKGSVYKEVPLTWDDLFDPQEGDHVAHGTRHGNIISRAKEMIRHLMKARGRTDILVCDDVKMFWADPSLKTIAPDIAVIPGVEDPERPRDSFQEKKEGTRPAFVLEVISKATGQFDYEEKPPIFQRARVRECFLLDPLTEPWTLLGRRLHPQTSRYRKIRPDKSGRILSQTLGLYFSIAPQGDLLILEDAKTGERLRDLTEEAEARQAAESQAQEAAGGRQAAETENQKLLAEIERLRARLSS